MVSVVTSGLFLAVFLAAPLAFMVAAQRIALVKAVGVVTCCYCAGLALGNLGPASAPEALTVQVLELVVPLSIPLLLFGADLGIWRRAGLPMLISFGSAVLAVSLAVAGASVAFEPQIGAETANLGGMMMGVYTGGTPNMSAIGVALDVPSELFVVLNAADLMFGGALLLLYLSIGKTLIRRVLPHVKPTGEQERQSLDERPTVVGSGLGLLLSAGIVGAAIGLSMLIVGRLHEMTILVLITSFGLAASLHPRVRTLRGTFAMGNYLLLVFCVAVGSLADLSLMLESGPIILGYVGSIVVASVLLHLLFARILRIDADTMMITSTAGVFGPAFVAPVARAIGNPALIPIGLSLALLGFAVGNYLGIAMAYMLGAALG